MSAGCSTLVLAPTEGELRHFTTQHESDSPLIRTEICGFGVIAAAARSSQLIALHKPQRVLLAGIAGTYDREELDIGQAACFRRVAVYGIGVGTASKFISAAAMGFPQLERGGQAHLAPKTPQNEPVPESVTDQETKETVDLAVPQSIPFAELLLSCCAASDLPDDIDDRLQYFPEAVAEDMEGFGVALACRLANVELTIVRGISNLVGDRNRPGWKIDEALGAAGQLVNRILESA